MLRLLVLVAAALIVVGVSLYPETRSDGASAGGAAVASVGGFDKLSGEATGHFHVSFPDYIQQYDGITTANVTWEEDPEYFPDGCHCRAFFATQPVDSQGNPIGGIDWTWNYVVEYSGPDDTCADSKSGHLEVGAGLSHPEEQILILFEDVSDPEQYIYVMSGVVHGETTINCDGGFTMPITDFLDVGRGPDQINTSTPEPLGAASPAAASFPVCDSVFRVRRDATRIEGSCYAANEGNPFDPYDFTKYTWNFSIPPQPIVFIHGFLGSEIKCGGDELWPNIPPKPRLLQMALDIDGVSPAPGACAATVGDILKTVPGKNIYGHTVDFLNQLYAQQPGSVYFFNWDWRTGPQQSLAKLDAKIDEMRASHENSKVVIMAHSYGGLLARLYVDNGGRAEKVARVLTVGTPAWGAPKALFPLYGGVEEPDAPFLSLGLFLNEDDLWEFSRNLLGEYFLYPSESYGPWLTIDPTSSTPVDRQGLQNYVLQLGGNPALLGQALNLHASTLDARYVPGPGDPKFEVIVGTGLPTITAVQVLPGGYLAIVYDNGDGTVPGRSAARGPMGPANPNKSRTHYSCHVGHVDLPGHSQITDAVKDYLKFGDDIEGLESPCSGSGFQIREFRLPHIASAASGSSLESASPQGAGDALPIGDAVQQGLADYLNLTKERFVITGAEFPEIALPQATFLEVTPLLDGAKGGPVLYGPLNGEITISAGAGGPVVLVDGAPAPLHGDVDCDGDVTPLDSLLLLLHAGATPDPPADGCSAIGSGAEPFGDTDCDGSITAMDGLADLRIVAGAPLTFVAGCQ